MPLIEDTLFGREDKIGTAIARLHKFEPDDGYYVAYSGGKDSDCIIDLVRRSGVKYDAHYSVTHVDPPEVMAHIREQKDVSVDYPPLSMWKLIEKKRMPPTRLVRYCCEKLKERGGTGRLVVTGVRWAESVKRSRRRMMESCFKDGTKRYLHAIIDWTNDDVWEYVQLRGIKTCKLYEEPGRTRIGCIMCPMAGGKRQRQDGDRWPNIKRAYLGAFTKMIAARVRDGLPTEWKTAEEAMEWWIQETNKKRPDDENTTIQLFE